MIDWHSIKTIKYYTNYYPIIICNTKAGQQTKKKASKEIKIRKRSKTFHFQYLFLYLIFIHIDIDSFERKPNQTIFHVHDSYGAKAKPQSDKEKQLEKNSY